MNTRQIILVSVIILLVGALAVWWYFGFSLGFMRFFAAEPGVDVVTPITTCQARPACLDALPSCDIAEPAEGWCKSSIGMVSCSPATQTVAVGTQATVTAAGGAGVYAWFAPNGTPPGASSGSILGAVFRVSYAVAGIKKVTVQSPRAASGVTDSTLPIIDSVACTVVVQ